MADISSIINLERYPFIASDNSEREAARSSAFVTQCREQFRDTGLCALPEFVKPQALDAMVVEANGVSEHAHFFTSTHNVYLDNALMASSPVADHREETSVGSVAYDHVPENATLRTFYDFDSLTQFIGAVVGQEPLYQSADILGACSINVFTNEGKHGWHFDEAEFTITLMLQPPESGGAFEYLPMIRGRDDEAQQISQAVNGQHNDVVQLPFSAGTLLIFGGRQTLHRVTDVFGDTPRLVPVLCYSPQAGSTNSPEVRQMFWGRTG